MAKIVCPLSHAAAGIGDEIALIEGDLRMTYRELETAVTNLTEYLAAAGVKRGDRIAIVEENRMAYTLALCALFRLGGVACLFSHRLGKATLEGLAERTNCTLQFEFPDSNIPIDKLVLPTITIPSALQLTSSISDNVIQIDLDQPATIMTTSGTTGTSKAVLHSYGNHYYSALGSNRNIPVRPGDRWLVSLSLFHVGGLAILFRCFLGGGTAVISRPSSSLLSDIVRYRATHISVVATQLRRLLADSAKTGGSDILTSLEAILLGGGPMPDSLLSEARQTGLPLFTSYGLTEMASQVCTSEPGSPENIRLLDFRQVCKSENNEILVKGETLFQGYVEGDHVERPVDAEGWFATGDIGAFDDHRHLTINGRWDNMFISGGENVHPEEIEFALMRQAEIEDAVVVPVEDAEFDFRPVAFVHFVSKDETLSTEVLRERLLDQGLPHFKIPVAFFPWPETTGVSDMKPGRAFLKSEARKLTSNL